MLTKRFKFYMMNGMRTKFFILILITTALTIPCYGKEAEADTLSESTQPSLWGQATNHLSNIWNA